MTRPIGSSEPCDAADEIARTIVDAAIEVHRVLGPGYLESVYEASMCHELGLRGVPHEPQVSVALRYKGAPVGTARLDLIVAELVVVELKAVPALAAVHTAQVISYLKATGLCLGLVLNFGEAQMKTGVRRVVLT